MKSFIASKLAAVDDRPALPTRPSPGPRIPELIQMEGQVRRRQTEPLAEDSCRETFPAPPAPVSWEDIHFQFLRRAFKAPSAASFLH